MWMETTKNVGWTKIQLFNVGCQLNSYFENPYWSTEYIGWTKIQQKILDVNCIYILKI